VRLTVLKNHVPISKVLVETPDPIERYEIFIGRSEDCHVLIDDPLISRHHLVLKNDNGHWFCEKITQLGLVSINGNTSQKMDHCRPAAREAWNTTLLLLACDTLSLAEAVRWLQQPQAGQLELAS
jgi:hypothetical protein